MGNIRVERKGTAWWVEAVMAAAVQLGADPGDTLDLADERVGCAVVIPADLTAVREDQAEHLEVLVGELVGRSLGVPGVRFTASPTRLIGLVPSDCDPGFDRVLARLAIGRGEEDLLAGVSELIEAASRTREIGRD